MDGRTKRLFLVTGGDVANAAYSLGVLLARRLLDQDQYNAGCRYAWLYRAAVPPEALPHLASAIGRLQVTEGRPVNEPDDAWQARQRAKYVAAVRALIEFSRGHRDCIDNVCVFDRLPGIVRGVTPKALAEIARIRSALDVLGSTLGTKPRSRAAAESLAGAAPAVASREPETGQRPS